MRVPLLPTLAAAVLTLIPIAGSGACGGKVVVDATGQSGAGGAGGAGGQGQGGTVFDGAGGQTTGSFCGFPQPVGVLINCGSTGSVGSGLPPECAVNRCDDAKNHYDSDCTGQECKCTYQPAVGTAVQCSCSLGATCTPGGSDCCPFHQ